MDTTPNIPPSSDQQPAAEEAFKPKKSKYSWSARFAVLIVILVLLGMGFIGYQAWRLSHQTSTHLDQLQTRFSNVQKNLGTEHQLAQANQVAMTELSSIHSETWTMNEIAYLIQMADVSLHIKQDIPTAIQLLQMAQQRVQILNDPKLITVAKLLDTNLSELKALPAVNTFEIYMRLQTLNNQIDQLSLVPEKIDLTQKTPEQKIEIPKSFWKKIGVAVWQAIKSLLVIQHHDQTVEPILTANQNAFLKLNLHVLFMQAQCALLQHENAVYQESLKEAKAWIKRYFIASDKITNAVLTEIDNLQKINIAPELPSMNQLLQAVGQINQTDNALLKNSSDKSLKNKDAKK